MASLSLNLVRKVFSASEHVAPRLAGRAAFELFCRTPNPNRLTPGERKAVDAAADFMAGARHHRLAQHSGCCIMVHEFKPMGAKRGTVLVIHGWRSRTEYMRSVIEGYQQAGYRVMSLDLPGHGGSLGRRLNMATAVQAVRVAADWFGPFQAMVGHSFGGAVAVNAAVGSVNGCAPVPAAKLVTIASPSSMPMLFGDFGDHMHLGPQSQAAVADQVKRVTGRALEEFASGRQLARTPIPTLVIHAPDDREVAAEHATMVAAAGSHIRLHWVAGLGHRRILADSGVVKAAVDFVAQHRETMLVH